MKPGSGGLLLQPLVKVLVTATVVVAISELAKRSTLLGAVIASLPLTSLLAFVWMHLDGAGSEKIAALSGGIFWLVIPSLPLFLILPLLLRTGWNFWGSLLIACAVTVAAYFATVWMLDRSGVKLG